MRSMRSELIDVLQAWLDEKGWNQAELARRTNRTTGAISLVFTGQRRASAELLIDIATAMGKPPERVLRIAGLLPPKPEVDALTEEGVHILEQLEGEDLEEGIRQLRLRLEVQEERGKYGVRRRKEKPAGA